MAFRYNPATGKFEVVPAGNSAGSQPPASVAKAPAAGPATVKQTVTNISQAKQPVVNIGQVKPEQRRNFSASGPRPAASAPPPRPVAGPPSPTTGEFPPLAAGNQPVQPSGPQPQFTQQDIIDSMWQAVYDEAAIYRQTYGEEPPAAWWSARTAPIEASQKRLDASAKGDGSGAAAAQKELERIRNIKGGQAGEAFLRQQAIDRKTEMLKTVADLYDPQKTKNAEDLKTILQQASDAYDRAEKEVGQAGEQFTKNFKSSTAYEGIPLTAYSVADNPLLAALQQQGASTSEVDAATNYARQFGQQTADLEKWAASQLNTGQKNYESAAQNAAQMGTMAALQGLSGRRADVKTGINQQFADALAQIGQEQTKATGDVNTTIADIIAKADEMKADTLAKYGTLPPEKKKSETTAKKPVVKKPVVVPPKPPVTNTKANIKRNVS